MADEAERYVITIGTDHLTVRLEDTETGEIHTFKGPRALHDALGVLAEWRERDVAHTDDHPAPCGYPDVIPCICSGRED